MKPRTTIVDNHALVAEALGKLLEPVCDVVGCYDDPRSFLGDAARLRPEVSILDVSMPSMNGLDAARELQRLVPATRIIFLTMNEDPEVGAEAFRIGGAAYLLKRSTASELWAAVRDVMRGRFYITPLLTRDLLGTLAHKPRARTAVQKLTARQREVLRLVAEGRSMKEAAGILNISVRTIAFHKYRIMADLGAHSTAALTRIAVREGLV
jgi:DNA-binding NarL/FixJ family response regulator